MFVLLKALKIKFSFKDKNFFGGVLMREVQNFIEEAKKELGMD